MTEDDHKQYTDNIFITYNSLTTANITDFIGYVSRIFRTPVNKTVGL